MGNRFSRKQDAPGNNAETAAAAVEQKAAEVPAAAQPAEDAGITQTQKAVEIENVVVGEPVTLVACLPTEECASECKKVEAPAAPVIDAEPEPVAKETPAPVQPEPLVSISEPSPPEPEPEPVVEAQLAPEPVPEPVPEPEPTSCPEAEVEAIPEPIPEPEPVPAPAEAMEPQTDLLTQESLPEPAISSPPLIDLGFSDATPEPINTTPSPAPISALVNADEPLDIPVTQECQDSAVISTFEPEMPEETSESLANQMEVEAEGNLEQLVSDVNEENLSGLLNNLDLKGNDLVADYIPNDVKIPDDTPIIDMSTSTELM